MKKQIFLAVMLSVVCFTGLRGQSWWRAYPQDSTTILSEVIPTEDGNFAMRFQKYTDNGPPSSYIFRKINPSNGAILRQDTMRFSPYHDGKSFTIRDKGLVTFMWAYAEPSAFKVVRSDSLNRLVRFDSIQGMNGIVTSSKHFVKRSDSTFFMVGSSFTISSYSRTLEAIIFNPLNLTVNYRNSIDTAGLLVGIESLSNSYVIFYSRSDTLFRVELNTNGTTLNRKIYLNYEFPSSGKIVKDRQENILLINANNVLKFNKNGDLLWEKRNYVTFRDSITRLDATAWAADIKVTSNGDCIISQRSTDNFGFGLRLGFSVYKISAQGDSIWWKKVPIPRISFLHPALDLTNDGGILITGFFPHNNFYKTTDVIKLDANGEIKLNYIQGQVKKDDNNNCRIDATDTAIRLGIVEATRDDGQVYRANLAQNNRFSIFSDTGNYTLKLITPSNLWQNCTTSISRRISTIGTTDTVDFLMKAVVDCPLLNVDLSVNALRRCFNNTFNVNYCNNGTSPATNAYVDVRLDSLIEFISATRPLASQNRNVFRFNLGTIGIGECDYFTINGRVKCGDSTRLGQTLCNEAHIYPDSVCLPTGTFSGANLTVSGSCVGDSIQFIVKNIGTATSQNRRSVVLEDEVLFQFNINGLSPNATFSRKYKANGSTWRMIVEQEPNNPNSQFPTAFVEGCGRNGNGGVSTGFGTTFGNDDASPSLSTLCRPIVGSFDPNDKQGFPTGYKTEHFIRQNQDLDYVIRFQNTGTDTAFLVTIRDTLSDVLDIASIEFGGSSHAYEADIYGKNIVKFTFQNINLPDSFRNVAASQGFVKFRIKQKKDLSIGTKINNKAGIYFDFNDPIITNTTLHTVARDVLITAIIEPNKTPNSLTINVSPNSFAEHATFELSENGKAFNSDFNATKFELYDALGRLLRSEKITNYRFDFNRNGLSNGLYFFKITDGGKVIGNGKFVVE
jgi:hypothetical protein